MWRAKKPESQKLLETRGYLIRNRSRLLSLYTSAAEKNQRSRMNYLNKKLQETGRMLDSLSEIETELLTPKSQGGRFLVSSLFLHDCFRDLTADSREQFFFITGSEADGLLVLDQKCGFEHISRTAAGVEGELKSTHSLLCKLEQFGHRFLAHFHSHPGRGVGATLPSAIDQAFRNGWSAAAIPRLPRCSAAMGLCAFSGWITTLNCKFMGKEWKKLNPISCILRRSIKAVGVGISGASDRQKQIAGFDQEKFSKSHVLCIGAGGLISNVAPALVRKGIGALTILDADDVEVSNLNRQRFYFGDIGQNKAIALVRNLQRECIYATKLLGLATSLESVISDGVDLTCDVAICGVDNNPARVAAARFFRKQGIPVIFTAVSAQADHGYVFMQKRTGPCIGCLFPDITKDESFPCPGTPAISDVLQLVGAIVTYAADAVLMGRKCAWNYRAICLPSGAEDWSGFVEERSNCQLFNIHGT